MGKYDVVDDTSGVTRVERKVDGVSLLGLTEGADITNTSTLSKFTKKIKKVLARQAEEVAAYEARYKDVPIVAMPPEYDPAGEINPQYTFLGNGYRWFEPDANQPVLYRVNPAGAPLAGGGVTEVNQALAAWTNVTTSSFMALNAGSTTQFGFRADGVSTVSFNDPLNQMQDPVGCSGILAIGGVSRTGSQSRTIGGRTFIQIAEGDVVFNNNFGCFLGVSTNLAEVSTHEIGHTIGFGHSTDGGAIMYAYAHGGNRGATLGADDVAAVAFLYPGSSTPPPPPPRRLLRSTLLGLTIATTKMGVRSNGSLARAGRTRKSPRSPPTQSASQTPDCSLPPSITIGSGHTTQPGIRPTRAKLQ